MNLAETLRLAFAALFTNKLRSGLTMLGIAVGVFSVIGVMTVITGLRANIETGLNVLGANSFEITKFPAINFSNPWSRFRNRRDISFTQAKRFKELMQGTADVSMFLRRNGRRVTYLDRHTNPNVRLIGTDENFVTSRNFEIAVGRNLQPEDVELGRAVVILGHDIAGRLFISEEPSGKDVRIDQQAYTVIGVMAPKGTSFGESLDTNALTTVTQYLEIYSQSWWRSLNLNVQAPSQELLEETYDQAIGMMRLVRRLGPEVPNDFEIFSNDSLIDAFNKVAGIVATGAFVISAIALLASGIGVMNIMLVSVTERTKEIGVRKSIGAKKRDILTQFLFEAIALSVAGGFVGVMVGVIGGNLAARMLNAVPVFPWAWAAGGLALCSAIGIIFGLYPAWKAAELDPIEALRYE